ncbi:DUF2975 domain-containing protein [bacterium]|jgi:hypothetical protein|nr:DUF2975 domain-containing protein [bacterium]
MSTTPSLPELDRRIRRAGKIGRFLCSTLLIAGTLLALWLMATAATNPEALVKLNLDGKHGAQVAGFRQAPDKLLALLVEKPEEVIRVAGAQQEANKYQDLVDHPEKRGGFVAVTALLATLILGFTWLLRQLFAAFAEGQVITAANARVLKRIGGVIIVCGLLGVNAGILVAGLLILILGWSLQQALALQAEQALVI